MIRLTVTDLVITHREVKVSVRCPKCKARLDGPDALTQYEYQDQSRSATITDDGVDNGDDLPQGGESFLSIGFSCAACGTSLAEGTETVEP